MLNANEKKKPGRPKKNVEDKGVKVEIYLTFEQYGYLVRRSKFNYTSLSEEARAVFDNEIENHPDEMIITMREEVLNAQKANLDNVKKIFYEDREHRVLIARSMIVAFLENHQEPIKDMFVHAHLENVYKRTGLDPNSIEDLFLELRKTFRITEKLTN
jgi:protoporphyrinogen oxidase